MVMSGSRCRCNGHSLSLAPVNPDWFYLPGFTFLVPAHLGTHTHTHIHFTALWTLSWVVPDKIQEGHKTVVCVCKKTERWGAGVVICLGWGADLHKAQLMPLPLTVSCFSKIHIGFTFLVLAYQPRQRAVKWVLLLLPDNIIVSEAYNRKSKQYCLK